MPTFANINQETAILHFAQARDWSASSFGHPSSWSPELHTIVRLILGSRFPMFIAWGPELRLLYNEAYIHFLGAKHPSALGSRFEDIWREIWPDISPLIAGALAGNATFVEDFPLVIDRHGRAEQTWVTLSYSPIQGIDGEVAGLYCAMTETTNRVLAERRQHFQLQVADTLRRLTDPQEIMAAASRLSGEYFGVGRVGYGEIDDTKQVISVARDWTNSTMGSLAGQVRPLDSFGPAIIEELQRGSILKLDNVAEDPRSRPYATGYDSIGAQSMLIVPMMEGQQLTAVLYLHEPHPRTWTAEEVTLAEDVALRTWEAVKRARTEEALRDETRILELFNETGQIVASTLDLQTLVQSITNTATKLSKAEFGAFFYNATNQQGESLTLYTLSGAPREAFEKFGQPRATALFGPTFNGDAPIRSADILEDPRYGQSKPHKGMPPGHLPVRSYLAVPVISRTGKVLGGLFFAHSAVGVFTERTERIIVGVAAQAAIAIDNARLYELAQKAAEEREELLGSERAARAEAERLIRMKDEFLAMLAHELRNPLAPISSAAELLNLRPSAEAWVKQTGTIIKRQVAHMRRLLDDLLDVSRVTHGLVAVAKRRIDFKEVVSGAVDQIRPFIEEKRHQLSIKLPSDPVYVAGDYTRLMQTVANILHNAVKYTPQGGNIHLRLVKNADQLEFAVEDNGSGIEPELLPNIFDLFTQGKRTLARSQGGVGLGLALVKKLVELHGGTVAAFSAGVDQGSTFVIFLPVSEGDSQDKDSFPKEHLYQETSLKVLVAQNLHVMVVDDNQDAADSLTKLLVSEGYSVTTAYTAQDSLEKVEAVVPDVFLLDIGLPDMNGYELARHLRARTSLAHSVLVALTGYGQSSDREHTAAAGFSHHLVKPVDLAQLWTVLEVVASKKAFAT